MIAAVLQMARDGLLVFPCGGNKQPLTPHGFKDASSDESIIREWWSRWPDAGIGIPTGKINNIIVLDIDMDSERGLDGEAALQDLLIRESAEIPTTRTIRTPRGGRHLYFKHPDRPVKNSTSKIGLGLDIKGDGGYIIAPPSHNGNGKNYTVEIEGPIADSPDWLEKLIIEDELAPASTLSLPPKDTPSSYAQAALRSEVEKVASAPNSTRNATLNKAAFSIGRFVGSGVLDQGEVENALLAAAERCGLSADEARKTISSGIKAGTQNIPKQLNAKTTELEPWGKPIGFDAPINLPTFPIDVLPEPFQSFVADVSASKQVPPDLPGALVLGAVAMAAAKRFRTYIGQSHNEPLNLFLLALMAPGCRKSDTFRACLAPVENFEIELIKNAQPAIAQAQERRAIEESRLTEIRKRAGRCDDITERKNLTIEAETLGASLTEISTPPRLIAGDVSPEHLASLLCANGGRMAINDAEGGLIFEIMAGRYSKNGGPNIEIFLKGHAGDTVRVDRTGRPSEFTRSAALTCILTAQPAILHNMAAKEQMRGRGLLARFLFTMPSGLIGTRVYANKPMKSNLVEQYADRLYDLLAVPPLDPDDTEAHRRLNLDGDALEIWRNYHDKNEKAQAPDHDLSHMTDFASKLPGSVARMAGILHLMKYGSKAPQSIEQETAAGAWALGLYFLEHTKTAFAEMGASGDMGLARRVYGWISRNRPALFTLGALFDDLRRGAGIDLSDDLLPAMSILEDRNIICREPQSPSNRPGRKSFGSWKVNPAIVTGEVI